jgi:Tfp pilus assembly protein PilF
MADEKPATEPHAHAAPAAGESEPEKKGFLERFNPINLFRRETPETFVAEGTRLLESRSLRQATAAFEKALELDENHAPAHRGLGLVTVARGGKTNLEAALAHFHAALKRNPFDEATYNTCAMVYEKLGNADAAATERKKMTVVKTLENEPANVVANNNMGILLMAQEQYDAALSYFRKAIEHNPKYDVAIRNLATALYQLATKGAEGKRAEYITQAGEAIESSFKLGINFATLLLQARIKLLAGDAEAALEAVTRAQAMDSSNKDGYAVKQMVLEKLGRMAEAQVAYEQYQRHAHEH